MKLFKKHKAKEKTILNVGIQECRTCEKNIRCAECFNLKEIKVKKEALEKQIPKKPQYVDTRFRHHGRKISDGSSLDKCYKCPNCNSHIFHVFDSEKCCKYCGQALDWSKTD